jgi:Sec-independent protein translocase protein TatA
MSWWVWLLIVLVVLVVVLPVLLTAKDIQRYLRMRRM